jgi:putative nucleotidyltransferase with HDIG domain
VVSVADQARVLAGAVLAEALPRRWRHVQAVAAKAKEIAAVLPEAERQALIAAAWLHDIGYAPGVADSGLHALDGARWLRLHGADVRVASLVAYHSCAIFEAEECGLADQLRAEFPAEDSPLVDALWYADMTTGPDGQDFDVLERLAEIRSRYGPDHLVTRFWARAEPVIVAAVRRTEERLAAVTQPM